MNISKAIAITTKGTGLFKGQQERLRLTSQHSILERIMQVRTCIRLLQQTATRTSGEADCARDSTKHNICCAWQGDTEVHARSKAREH